MGTLNRAFNRVKRWLTSPGKTFGTGWAPTRRTIPEPSVVVPSGTARASANRDDRQTILAIRRRRAANKVARRSRRINQLRSA